MSITNDSGSINSDFVEMVKSASKAPSGHNSQPWKFQLSADTISIFPDLDFALPAVDGSHRELLISLGAATENLCIAATHWGYEYQIISQGKPGIVVRFSKSDRIQENPLFEYIDKRQTNRSIYNKNIISNEKQDALQNIIPEPNIKYYFVKIGTPLADTLTRYIIRGNTLQMKDEIFKKELLSWIRYNKKHVAKTRNGLTYQVLGFPPMPVSLARPLVKFSLETGIQGNSDLKKIKSSSHLIIFTSCNNTPEEWIDLGRTMQRFLLMATGLEVVHAYMNQPCEVESLAKEMRNTLPDSSEFPSIILRIGVSAPMPYSPRKEVEDIIVK